MQGIKLVLPISYVFCLLCVFCYAVECKGQDSIRVDSIQGQAIQKAKLEAFDGKIYSRNHRHYYRFEKRIGRRAFDNLLGKSSNQEIKLLYQSSKDLNKTGNYFGYGGLAFTVIGFVLVDSGILNLLFSYPPSSPTSMQEDRALASKLITSGIITGGIGLGGLTTCIVLKSQKRRKLKKAVELFNTNN